MNEEHMIILVPAHRSLPDERIADAFASYEGLANVLLDWLSYATESELSQLKHAKQIGDLDTVYDLLERLDARWRVKKGEVDA